ncbi:pyrimidine/purine-5'-nucleotide nucleosidase [Phycisphaerales bacterium]|nr:pyrimidine/purine-5'-nucleotide nucleosidase [Phycisphaerales bacterium]
MPHSDEDEHRAERMKGRWPNGTPWRGVGDPDLPKFLAGPTTRVSEAMRVVRIGAEFIRGFRAFHFMGPCVSVFGSARFAESSPHYALGREMGRRIARMGLNVVTGGGPGIMEAANRGAKEEGGYSLGCNIVLPQEQKPNPYLDRFITFRYFFVRKVMLVKYSLAFVVLPGGFGTMDELFEAATLVQTGKILSFPIVLMGVDYWRPLMEFLQRRMVIEGTISPPDADLLVLTDSPDEAVRHIERGLDTESLDRQRRLKKRWWLGER